MQCLYCQTALAPLRVLSDGEYCSDEHRLEHAVGERFLDRLFSFPRTEASAGFEPPKQPPPAVQAFPFLTALSLRFQTAPSFGWLEIADAVAMDLVPGPAALASFPSDHVCPPWTPEPASLAGPPSNPTAPLSTKTPALESSGFWASIRNSRFGHLRFAARHWKLAASLVPVLLAAAFDSSTADLFQQAKGLSVFSKTADYLRRSMEQRAAVVLTDDFRSGLVGWESRSDVAAPWAFDSKGFVRPGTLAVYRSSMSLTDYKLEFVTQLDEPLGAAFRIEDWSHYYAFKLVVAQSGPAQAITAVRYAVVDGKEVDRVVRQLPPSMPNTSLYRIGIDVHGSDFTLISQGHVVDYWSDGRYARGGVGFFGGKGGRARVRWVEVSHQYDWVGRLLALLTPNDGQARNQFKN